jgi:DNA invertase Pin-like site-specific DNA recombinase
MRTKKQSLELIPVIGVIRVSTDKQAEEDRAGIPRQREEIVKICERDGLHLLRIIQIEGVSGTKMLHWSLAGAEIRRLIATSEVRGIVMAEQSRLLRPRKFKDLEILDELKDNNVKVHLSDSIIDMQKPSDWMVTAIKALFAGYELDVMHEHMHGARESKIRDGQWMTGDQTLPFGLRVNRENKRFILAVDDEKIKHVIRLFDLFVSGETSFSKLHAAIPEISYDAVRIILTNPIYTGWHVRKKRVWPNGTGDVMRTDGSGKLRYQKRRALTGDDEEEPIRMLDNPPISQEIFQRAQKLFMAKVEMHWKRKEYGDDPFLYRGLLRCGAPGCGRNITTVRMKDKRRDGGKVYQRNYYMCSGICSVRAKKKPRCKARRIAADILEPHLDAIIKEDFARFDLFSRTMKAMLGEDKEKLEERVKHLQSVIAQANADMNHAAMGWARRKLTDQEHDMVKETLTAERRAAEDELVKIRPNYAMAIDDEMWVEMAMQFQRWADLSREEKRAMLVQLAPIFTITALPDDDGETCVNIEDCRLSIVKKPAAGGPAKTTVDIVTPSHWAQVVPCDSITIPINNIL